MTNELNWERLNYIETKWESIENSYRLAPFNAPINREVELRKIIDAYQKGVPYNPNFSYLSSKHFPVQQIVDFLGELQPLKYVLDAMYFEKGSREIEAINRVLSHSAELITETTILEFGQPDDNLLKAATDVLLKPSLGIVSVELDIPDFLAVEQIQDVLRNLNLPDWKCVIFEPLNSQISVNRLEKEIRIRKGTSFSKHDLKRLVVHEVGVHVIRNYNGKFQPLRLFQNGFPGYLPTEEGLAVTYEDKAGLLDDRVLRKYAVRVLAAHLSLTSSFFDVFCKMINYLQPDTAFDVVARAKRGFIDTSMPGAHVKDIIYLQGYLNVNAYTKNNPDDAGLLFLGKIGLQHIEFVKELMRRGRLQPVRLLPKITEIMALWDEQGA
jgi:hypothetical protein